MYGIHGDLYEPLASVGMIVKIGFKILKLYVALPLGSLRVKTRHQKHMCYGGTWLIASSFHPSFNLDANLNHHSSIFQNNKNSTLAGGQVGWGREGDSIFHRKHVARKDRVLIHVSKYTL